MDSAERLIKLVQSHPCLYNSSHKHYRNNAQKELVWQKISQELQQSCETTKNKWKNLKDGYTKFKKHKKGGTGQKKPYSKWIWGSYLKFLDAHAQSKTSSDAGNASPSSQGFDMDDDLSSSPGPVPCEVMLPSPPLQSSRHWASEDQDAVHQILDYIKNDRNNDATDHLFASYAKTFKKLKPRTQHSVKLQLAQMFADAELKDLDTDNQQLTMMTLSPVCYVKSAPSDSEQ